MGAPSLAACPAGDEQVAGAGTAFRCAVACVTLNG